MLLLSLLICNNGANGLKKDPTTYSCEGSIHGAHRGILVVDLVRNGKVQSGHLDSTILIAHDLAESRLLLPFFFVFVKNIDIVVELCYKVK